MHFLVSMALVWAAVVLVSAVGEAEGPLQPVVPRAVRGLVATSSVVLGALLLAGTFVTAAGPHSGDADTPRLAAGVPAMAQLHADLLFAYLGLLAGLGFALRAVAAPAALQRRYAVLVAVVAAQGAPRGRAVRAGRSRGAGLAACAGGGAGDGGRGRAVGGNRPARTGRPAGRSPARAGGEPGRRPTRPRRTELTCAPCRSPPSAARRSSPPSSCPTRGPGRASCSSTSPSPGSTTSTRTTAAAPTRSTCRSCSARRERAGWPRWVPATPAGSPSATGSRGRTSSAATPNAWPSRPTPPSPCRTRSPTTSPSAPSCRA